jgi:hypothetical protein
MIYDLTISFFVCGVSMLCAYYVAEFFYNPKKMTRQEISNLWTSLSEKTETACTLCENTEEPIHVIKILDYRQKYDEKMKLCPDHFVIYNDDNETDHDHTYDTSNDDTINNRKCDLFNCYVEDLTPAGLVFMHYCNEKDTFEYYSDKTIPFWCLESVCKKYVTTFFCKPLFVDKEEVYKQSNISSKCASTNSGVFAKYKAYNTNTSSTSALAMQTKGRTQDTLPPAFLSQYKRALGTNGIPLNTVHVANRYTRGGRLSDMNIIKQDKKKKYKKNMDKLINVIKPKQEETLNPNKSFNYKDYKKMSKQSC